MKRIISFLLALVLAIPMIPNVFAAEETSGIHYNETVVGDYVYEIANGEATITGYTGEGGDIAIPAELGGYPVTAIGDGAFYNCDSLISVFIPDSVTNIGSSAFTKCDGLTNVTIPDSVIEINQRTFEYCSKLYSISIPDSVISIGVCAFRGCSSLIKITLGRGLANIGQGAIWYCDSLKNVYYHGTEEQKNLINIDSYNDDLLNATWNYESTGDEPEEDFVAQGTCGAKLTWVLNELGTLTISGQGAMYDFTSNHAPWSECFEEIRSIEMDPEMTTIGNYAFYYLPYVSTVTVPEGVTKIGISALESCYGLRSVTVPASVTEIGRNAFADNLCLGGIWVDENNAVYSSDAKGVLFNKDKTLLIRAPGELSGTYTIPQGVQTIGQAAFAGCTELYNVNIPTSVTNIDAYSFDAENLTDVYYGGMQEQWDAIIIGEGNQYLLNANLHMSDFQYSVKDGKAIVTGYLGANTNVVVPAELGGCPVVAIGNSAFKNNQTITSVTLPDSMETIGEYAFWDCRKLETVNIPVGVITIGDFAFYRCESLKAVTIPNTVTAIGDYAFQMCWSLESITIPGSVKQMYEGVFADCINLRTVVLEEGVTAICTGMFAACKALQSITIPKSVTAIHYIAFASCDSLTDIYYQGDIAVWKSIHIDADNSGLKNAKIHYAEHTHSYIKKVTMPTCTAKGYTTYTCSCGDTYKANYVNAKGHTYSKGKCTACGYKPAGAKITVQPVNVAVKSGKTATVSVKASGTGLKYAWYMAKKGSSKFTKTTVTSASYSVKMSSSVNGRKVYCEITDSYGNVVKSNTVTLYKGTPAKITTQPKNITVGNSKTGKLTIKASGSSLKYTWYVKYKGASAFTKVGKSSKTYSFTMATKLDGAQAYCVVKDKYGIEVKSSVVTIKLAPQPKITTQPQSVLQVKGKKVSFTVKASGEGLKYQWYYAKKGSSSFKKVSGAKRATYTVKVSSSVNGRKYYCLVTDKYGQTVKSSAATLSMKTVAKITTQPKNVTVKNGKTAKFTVKAVGDDVEYVWFVRWPNSDWEVLTWGTRTLSFKTTKDMNGLLFMCCAVDKYENVAMSKEVKLKVK